MPTQRFDNLPEEKKERITEAIIDVFAEKGVDEADIADIVRTAKIARGSFYQYFEDKDDAIFHIIKRIQNDKLSYLGPLMKSAQEMPFVDFYQATFNASLDFVLTKPKYLTIGSYVLTSKSKKIKEYIRVGMENFQPFFDGLINKDKAAGLIRKDIDNRVILLLISNATSDIVIDLIYERHTNFNEVRKIFDGVFQIIKKGIAN